MLLAVDIGNTSISVGLFRKDTEKPQGDMLFCSKLSTDARKSADEYAVLLHSVFSVRGFSIKDVTSVIVGSVVPPMTDIIKSAVSSLLSVSIYVVGPGLKTGINIRTDDPAELGADIVANAVGALLHTEPPFVMVDVGTATSVFAVDEKRAIVGGCIAPGLKVSADALRLHASRLPSVSLTVPDSVIGKNTDDAVRAGILYGHAMMIDGMVHAISSALGFTDAKVVLTGGLSNSIKGLLKHKVLSLEGLTLEGLWGIYRYNERKTKKA